MDAFLTGYETACRIGLLVAPGHYEEGFHSTATIGTFGSAAACARLLNLDQAAGARALSIAATRAAGLKAVFGTACKPLHAGLAATNGLFAAELAQQGFDSREDGLECRQGFAATHSPDFDREAAFRDPKEGYHLYNNLFKFHAACYLLQSTIECGHKIRTAHNLAATDIRAVRVRANRNCNDVCNISEPRTGLEMKFSFRAAAALSLTGLETSRPDVFSDANANSPPLNSIRDRVAVELTSDFSVMQSEMEVLTSDGRTLHARHDSGIPTKDRAAQGTRILEKFHALVEPVLGRDRSEEIAAQVAGFEHLKHVGDLMRLCV
jgi:2-methylcitrate dehydratase PrpD